MSITITSRENNSSFHLKVPVTFKGRADGGIVRVELFAEQYYLGGDDVELGDWVLTYPEFYTSGVRQIRVVGLDRDKNKVASEEITIVLSNSNPLGFEPGIDVSDFDGSVNWRKVKGAGFSFAFAKATEGRTWKATTFPRNWRQMEGAGIIRGAYHFFRPTVDPQK
ncbi:MAG: hypothetical protein GDA44_13755 [Prochloron sp. SP5CPC1]|nr:hypothetical protein [Candidatus Paraprochloron terpiosi SP5CPC1]